ncbi:hypothetical protein C0Q70_03932 [Pomacea canaliculata]|uniref:Uncharacterized protein n=1 Tax=Pomacea canaliculata TaxID=400727 RepID=A0A2T7PU52_POMCA|nr:hypothetical protein C0Q70_03932 [Pomacea canaliculata]
MKRTSACHVWLMMSLLLCGAAVEEKAKIKQTQLPSLPIKAAEAFRPEGAEDSNHNHEPDDSEPHTATDDKRFDRISSATSFSKFGKRDDDADDAVDEKRFDRISTMGAMSRFGKRPADFNEDEADSESKRFDRISSANGGFAKFGKRWEGTEDSGDEEKRFDRISSSSGFSKFGKRQDPLDGSDQDFDKRFDRISSASGFSKFGKRPDASEDLGQEDKRFDRISSATSYAKFGKRDDIDEANGDEAAFDVDDKRLDRISSASGFAKFGKRQQHLDDSDYLDARDRRFDRISSANDDVPEIDDKRFDRISSASGFSKFGKRDDDQELIDKRFDRISSASGFSKFGKRFDRISSASGFSKFGKRFDRISSASGFSKFGKRDDDAPELDDKRFDRISSASGFSRFGKRNDNEFADKRFDRISSASGFSKFGKRFDRISSASGFSKFGKRDDDVPELDDKRFDRISSASGLSKFGKRENLPEWADKRFDRISSASGFSKFGKRQNEKRFDRISSASGFGKFGKRMDELSPDFEENSPEYFGIAKRAFDRIGASSAFAKFGKRVDSSQLKDGVDEKRAFDRIASASNFAGFGKRGDVYADGPLDDELAKRSFDRISSASSFSRIGNGPHSFLKTKKDFDRIGLSRFASFGKRSTDSTEFNNKLDFVAASPFSRFGEHSSFSAEEGDGESLQDKSNLDRISSMVSSLRKSDEQDGQAEQSSDGIEGQSTVSHNLSADVSKMADTKQPEKYGTGEEGIRTLTKRESSDALGTTLHRVKRGFDSIGTSSFSRGFGKYRRLNSPGIYRDSGGLGKRIEEKYPLDTIAPSSFFSGFGKREPHSQSLFENDEDFLSSPDVTDDEDYDEDDDDEEMFEETKRKFDRIGTSSNFGKFGKRSALDEDDLEDDQLQGPVITHRPFARIGYLTGFGSFGKRSTIEPYLDLQQIDLDPDSPDGDYSTGQGKSVYPGPKWIRYLDRICGPLNIPVRRDSYRLGRSDLQVPHRMFKRLDRIGHGWFSRFRKRFGYETELAPPNVRGSLHYVSICTLAMLLKEYYSALAEQESENIMGARPRRSEDKRFDRISYGHFAKWGRK